MKKFIAVSAALCLLALSFSAMATEPRMIVKNAGDYYVKMDGKSGAWADAQDSFTKALSGGQFQKTLTIGDEANGLKMESVGGWLSEGEGPDESNVGGYTQGYGEFFERRLIPYNEN